MAKKECTHCKEKTGSETISLAMAECEATRQNIVIKRLIWLIALLIVLLFGSNLAWIAYESQYETIKETYEVEQDTICGHNNCVIQGGEIDNGTSEN